MLLSWELGLGLLRSLILSWELLAGLRGSDLPIPVDHLVGGRVRSKLHFAVKLAEVDTKFWKGEGGKLLSNTVRHGNAFKGLWLHSTIEVRCVQGGVPYPIAMRETFSVNGLKGIKRYLRT